MQNRPTLVADNTGRPDTLADQAKRMHAEAKALARMATLELLGEMAGLEVRLAAVLDNEAIPAGIRENFRHAAEGIRVRHDSVLQLQARA